MDNPPKFKNETPLPIEKHRRWIAALEHGIGSLDDSARKTVMKPAGNACASDLFALCERYLGKKISDHKDLVLGWNKLRKSRGLKGSWEIRDGRIEGIFGECGCPLVRFGLIRLHPAHCYCSQAMMEAIFERIIEGSVAVEIIKSIGRGDDVCHFSITMTA